MLIVSFTMIMSSILENVLSPFIHPFGRTLFTLPVTWNINIWNDFQGALPQALTVGASAGLTIVLLYGGWDWLRHYTLRLLLWRARMIPWDYVGLLDEAARHILLRKVGGGYTFIHRLFQDYIASLDTASFLSSSTSTASPAPTSLPIQKSSEEDDRSV